MGVMTEKKAFAGNLNTTSPAHGQSTARRTNMTAIKRNLVTLGVFVGIVGTPLVTALADECKGNDPVNPTKRVCATWSDPGDPELLEHFTVSYECDPDDCSDAPRVELITGGTTSTIAWVIYSEELDGNGAPTGPANLGDVVLADDVSPDSGQFTVAIRKGTVGVGALNVSSIVLNSSDINWTGHSTLTEAGSYTVINGNVTGDIVAVERSGGGQAEGATIITGNVEGTLTIPQVTGTLAIYGDLSCGYVETINSGASLSIGSLGGAGCADPAGGRRLNVTGALAGTLKFTDQLVHGAFINIVDFEGSGKLNLNGFPTYPQINLYNGVDSADARVDIAYHGGSLYMHDKDMLGVMNFPWFGDGAGVFDGGVLKGSVSCGVFPNSPVNKGTLEFASVAAGGQIVAENLGPFQGRIDIAGAMGGLINIKKDLDQGSSNLTGVIVIGGDVKGRVECEADVTASAEITIGGMLAGTGKITVDGVCDGDISVGKNTTSNTLIHCESGLGATGRIFINASEGNFNAAGSITVGSNSFAPIAGDYDGCIHILDEDGTGLGGDLNGQVRIAVCDDETPFDPGFDHNVCVDGDVNGTIEVVNSSCANRPGYACTGECDP